MTKQAIDFKPGRGTTIRLDRNHQRKLAVLLEHRNRDLPRGVCRVTMAQLVREWVTEDYRRLCDLRRRLGHDLVEEIG